MRSLPSISADGKYEVTYESNVVLMQPDGAANIYQVPPAIYKSSCDINVEYFPFDEQECEMKFGSWTFEADQLNFTYYKFYGLDMTDYLKSGTWDIVDCPARIVICTDPETKRRISMYIAKFIIRRKTLFYTVNLIIPCMLISFVSICVFMLPADAGEKITLIISILLALVVFLLLISKLLPPSKTIPLIAKYLLFTFIMNIIAIGSTVFIINRNYRTPRTHRMPEWVRIVFLKYLPKFLFMTRPNHDQRWKSPLKVHSEENLDNDIKRHGNHDMSNTRARNCRLHNVPEATEVGYTPMSPELIEATEAIGFITEHLKWEDRYGSVTNDWKYMASVVDRMLLYIFLIVTVCGTVGILVQAPYILENIDQDELIGKIMDKYKVDQVLSLNRGMFLGYADGKYEVSYESNILLSYDSLVYWIPPAIYKSSCTIDVQFFPFDQQICEMKFGSWTFTDKQLNFTFYNNMDSLDFTDYLKSGTWDIIAGPGRITTEIDPGSNQNKAMVIFEFHLRRKTLFYTVNLIIPCILISFVSVCVFLLPADACEKITLCISILLALVVFLLLISKILPPSLQIPLIAHYLLFTFIMNILAICLTVFVINKNFRTPRTHQMPNWIRIVFLNYLPRLLLMTRPKHMERWQKPKQEITDQHSSSSVYQNNVTRSNHISSSSPNFQELTESHHPGCRRQNNRCVPEGSPLLGFTRQTANHSPGHAPKNKLFQMTPELREATDALKFITEHLKAEDEYDTVLDDWKFVASVLDRLLLIVFLTVTIFGSMGILMQTPYILEYVDQDEIIQKLMKKYMK